MAYTHTAAFADKVIVEICKDMTMSRAAGNKLVTMVNDVLSDTLKLPAADLKSRMLEVTRLMLEEYGIADPADIAEWTFGHLAITAANVVLAEKVRDGIPTVEQCPAFALLRETLLGYVPLAQRSATRQSLAPSIPPAQAVEHQRQQIPQQYHQQQQQQQQQPQFYQQQNVAPTELGFEDDEWNEYAEELYGQQRQEQPGQQVRGQSISAGAYLSNTNALDPAQWVHLVTSPTDARALVRYLCEEFRTALETAGSDGYAAKDMMRIIEGLTASIPLGRAFPEPLQSAAKTALKRLLIIKKIKEGHSASFAACFSDAVEGNDQPSWIAVSERQAALRAKILNDNRASQRSRGGRGVRSGGVTVARGGDRGRGGRSRPAKEQHQGN